jgi:hypothetical protein
VLSKTEDSKVAWLESFLFFVSRAPDPSISRKKLKDLVENLLAQPELSSHARLQHWYCSAGCFSGEVILQVYHKFYEIFLNELRGEDLPCAFVVSGFFCESNRRQIGRFEIGVPKGFAPFCGIEKGVGFFS